MASAISDDPKERAELSKWRTIGTQIAIILIAVLIPTFIYYTNEAGQTVLSGTRVTISATTAFETDVINGIYDITCLVLAVAYSVLTCTIIFLYPLGKKRVEANTAELRRRREVKL